MKISTKGRYGLRFMVDLAGHDGLHPISLRDISERQGISEKYLWQVVSPLKAAGLIASTAGAQGGYQLTRPAAQITVYEILRSVEGDLSLVPCTQSEQGCPRSRQCAVRLFWQETAKHLVDHLNQTTLEDLYCRQHELDQRDIDTGDCNDYCI